MEYGIDFLKQKLTLKQPRVNIRYEYYEMKNSVRELSGIIPAEFKRLSEVLGWCAKSVDSLADRLFPDGFSRDNFLINEIFTLNNSDVLFDSAVLSALISSCSFIYVGIDGDNYPKLQVIDGANATGIIDPVTYLLTEGYAVLERDDYGKTILEAYFKPYCTEYYQNGRLTEVTVHKAPYALLVPIIYRPDAKRPFGHSRISRSCMSIVQSALRTLRRAEICSEFYAFPQKYILGLGESAEFNKVYATMSAFLAFGNDENGNKPSMGQFQTASLAPYAEQIKMYASLFAGETGLTLDDLGFVTSNPSSAEAIRSAHENLRLTARKAQRTFSCGFVNAGYLSACIRDNFGYERKAFAGTKMEFMPVFEPDSASLASIGDAVLKINQACPDFLGAKNIRHLTGLESDSDE